MAAAVETHVRLVTRFPPFGSGEERAETRRETVAAGWPVLLLVNANSERMARLASVEFIVFLGLYQAQARLLADPTRTLTEDERRDLVCMLAQLYAALRIEVALSRGLLTDAAHRHMYRCRLDPSRAPLTERSVEASTCPSERAETFAKLSEAGRKEMDELARTVR
jgi:hypothetical protein